MLSIYVAAAENRVIGRLGEIPWRLSADMKRLSATTKGHTVIMGRKTHDSILKRLGKPLPERKTIIITRQKDFQAPNCVVTHSLEEALTHVNPNEETFVFGGAEIYKEALPLASKIYYTKVHAEIDGDAYFPALKEHEWKKVSEENHKKDEKNEFNYSFVIYERN